jgi:hypothetical protein
MHLLFDTSRSSIFLLSQIKLIVYVGLFTGLSAGSNISAHVYRNGD